MRGVSGNCFMIRTLTFFHEISERADIFVGRLHFALSKVDVLEDWVWLFGPWRQAALVFRSNARPFEPSDSDVDFLTFKYLLLFARASIDICLLRVFPSILLRHIILSIKFMFFHCCWKFSFSCKGINNSFIILFTKTILLYSNICSCMPQLPLLFVLILCAFL